MGGDHAGSQRDVLIRAPAEKSLAYQVAVSIPILALGALLSGEKITHMPGTLALASMAYQTFLGGRDHVPDLVFPD